MDELIKKFKTLHIFKYINQDKIDQLYFQIFPQNEKDKITIEGKTNKRNIISKIGLGKLFSTLGVDISFDGGYENGNIRTEQTTLEKTIMYKLLTLMSVLERGNRLFNLNKMVEMNTKLEEDSFIIFESDMLFSKNKQNPKGKSSQIIAKGQIGIKQIEFFSSSDYYIGKGSYLFSLIYYGKPIKLKVFAIVEHWQNEQITIIPIAF